MFLIISNVQYIMHRFSYNEDNIYILMDQLELLIPKVAGFGEEIRRKNEMLHRKRYSIAAAIWRQKSASEKLLFVDIIHVLCTKYNRNQLLAVDAIDHSTHIVFRIKKRQSLNTGYGFFHIFVDDHARVYQNWDDYICNNYLPEGVLVAPAGGFYDFDENNDVRLEFASTPATQTLFNNKEINKIAGILGLAAASVTVISLVRPLPSCVMTGASAVGICVTIWSTSSKVLHLIDRRKHEQTICVSSEECREIWLSLSSSILAVATRNANALLKNSVSLSGDVSPILQNTVNGLNMGAIAISCLNVYKSAFEIINKRINNRSISPVDLLQVGVSAYLVTNSMNNFQSASRIIEIRRTQLKLENEMKISSGKASNELQNQEKSADTETDLIYSTKVKVDSLKTHAAVKQMINDGLILPKPNRQVTIEVAPHIIEKGSNIKLDPLPPTLSNKSESTIPSLSKDQKPPATAETDLNYSIIANVDSLKTQPTAQLIEDRLMPNQQVSIEEAPHNNFVEILPKPSNQSKSIIQPMSKDQKPEKIISETSSTPSRETNTTTKSVSPAGNNSTSSINFWKIMDFAKVNSVYYYKACENMIRKYAIGDGQAKSTDNKTETDSANAISPAGNNSTSSINFWKIMDFAKVNSVYYYKACENMIRKYAIGDGQAKSTDNKTETDSSSSNQSHSSYLSRIAGTCYNYSKYSVSKCYEYSKGPIGYCYSGLKSFFSKPKNDD